LYVHTNKTNGKKYIGITCQEPERRWREDGYGYRNTRHLYNSILKNGWDNFEHDIIRENMTKEEAETEEIKLIKQYNTTDRTKGYNISNGGNANGKHSVETRKIMSEKAKERPICYDKLAKMHEVNTGREYSEEHCQKISDALLGRKLSDEHRKNISESHKGYLMPDAQKEKIRESMKRHYDNPENRKRASDFAKNNEKIIEHLRRMAAEKIQINKQVILTNTGEVFENHIHAGKITGIQNNKILKNCLQETLRAGKDKESNPAIWCFLDEYDKEKDYIGEYRQKIKNIKSNATKKRYA
jgi:group I intron endonuclease